MKTLFLCIIIANCLALAACSDNPISTSYKAVLPELPPHWEEIPAKPHWRLQWIGDTWHWQEKDISPGQEVPNLHLGQEWQTPVIAWPFWPELNLLPGIMKPCGALFPWDIRGEKIILDWEGGVIAIFWKEMAAAERLTKTSAGRPPWFFDWLRFRELLSSDNIPAAVREDLWLPDWKSIAEKTINSGFDRRRIVSRSFSELSIPGLGGQWIGSSPFAAAFDAGDSGPLVLKVTGVPDTWVSTEGILKCASNGWVFKGW